MILNFNDFCDNVIKTDEVDYINEKLTVSMDVNDMTDELVKFIEGYNGEKIVVDSGDYYSVSRFKENPVVDVFGCKCELDLNICEFSPEVPVEKIEEFFDATTYTKMLFVDGVSKVNFTLSMNVAMKDGKMIQESRSILSHELRHAYEKATVYNNCPEMDSKKRIDIIKKWNNIYCKCVGHIKLGRNPLMRWLSGEEFYEILGAMYHCDTSEVSAFTQQAYEQCKDCKSKQETKLKMKDTDLYKTMELFDDVMHLLEDDDVKKSYIENKIIYRLNDFPSIHQLVKLITKRYIKIRTNYGKVLTLICGRFEKNKGLDLVDVKY